MKNYAICCHYHIWGSLRVIIAHFFRISCASHLALMMRDARNCVVISVVVIIVNVVIISLTAEVSLSSSTYHSSASNRVLNPVPESLNSPDVPVPRSMMVMNNGAVRGRDDPTMYNNRNNGNSDSNAAMTRSTYAPTVNNSK